MLSSNATKVMEDVAGTEPMLANGALRSFLVSSGEAVLTPDQVGRQASTSALASASFLLASDRMIATLKSRLVGLELFGREDEVPDACMSDLERKEIHEELSVPPSSHGCAGTVTT